MMNERNYYVYILTNKSQTTLYVGVTNDLIRRVYEHKNGLVQGFTSKYRIDKLVYYESGHDAYAAIAREKQLKSGSRKHKTNLINSTNPQWQDLFDTIIQ